MVEQVGAVLPVDVLIPGAPPIAANDLHHHVMGGTRSRPSREVPMDDRSCRASLVYFPGTFVSVVGPGSLGRVGGFAFLCAAGTASIVAAVDGLSLNAQSLSLGGPDTHITLRLDSTMAFSSGILGLVAFFVAVFNWELELR